MLESDFTFGRTGQFSLGAPHSLKAFDLNSTHIFKYINQDYKRSNELTIESINCCRYFGNTFPEHFIILF